MSEKGKRIEKYKLMVTKWSWECEAQHGKIANNIAIMYSAGGYCQY